MPVVTFADEADPAAAPSKCDTSASSASCPGSSLASASFTLASERSSFSSRRMSALSCSFHWRSEVFSADTSAARSRSRATSPCNASNSARSSATSCCEASYMACIVCRSSLSSCSCFERTACWAATAGDASASMLVPTAHHHPRGVATRFRGTPV